jgi:DNA polymerase elongation subunit (family B)
MSKADNVFVKLFDFRIYNADLSEESDSESKIRCDKNETVIQMYGMNEVGKTFAINITDYKPFFYVKTPVNYTMGRVKAFERSLKKEMGFYYGNSIVKCKLVEKKKLYGFDDHKEHKFIKIVFKNTNAFNKARSLWYTKDKDFRKRTLKPNGYEKTKLYEAKLPPLLRFFHIKDISPSGWISFDKKAVDYESSETCCDYEYWISYRDIKAERKKETAIPLKICSFDIEASSSHGDFPLAKKTYLKLCRQIVNYWTTHAKDIHGMSTSDKRLLFKELTLTAFGYCDKDGISQIYLKKATPKQTVVEYLIDKLLDNKLWYYLRKQNSRDEEDTIEATQRRQLEEIELEDEEIMFKKKKKKKKIYFKQKEFYQNNIIYLLNSKQEPALIADMIEEIFKIEPFPAVEGDTVTFIGSTFMRLGEADQYLNHMIVLNSCSECPDVPNCQIETYDTEKEVLLAWTNMIQREDPDIVIGYNIFGFDYKFMIERTEELKCKSKFLELSRMIGEESRVIDSSIKIASGTHDLKYIKMEGRIQIDLYNHFRREVNLPSYKLDNVASHFIGDMNKKFEKINEDITKITSKNLMGLKNGHYIKFEILGHSSDMYKGGKKYIVDNVNSDAGTFTVNGDIAEDLSNVKSRWCLAKDDVTPQDIFRLTNEGPDERAIIAKYCFQDCNLVHNLMKKNDIFTGMSEIAGICYVPIEFIVMRGQGIKLLSFIAKKCSEKDTLMPVLDVVKDDMSYEGAICLKPYCGLYIDNPVAVVDYASLYPSSMISENISHDSKVWTKEYDLDGNIVKDEFGKPAIWGIRNGDGTFKYDNLPGYRYVDITYDRYIWRRKGAGKAQEKVKVGTKTCRFAQFPDNNKAIMPSVLHELLAGRKATRKFIKYKTVTMKSGEEYSGLYSVKDSKCSLIGEKEKWNFNEEDVESVRDTYDDFMKNVFDKRQLGLKVTANSLYGQTGAKTSSFFEMDIAASTTATGRKLLIYGKKIIEGIYGNKICETKYGTIRCKSKVVYGDSVLGDTPMMLRNKNTGEIIFKQIDELNNDEAWSSYEGFKAFETNRREKQQKSVDMYEIYTSNGWSDIVRVIRHKTKKKIYRITTHTGVVDVTEDHSLLDDKLNILKPKDVEVGMTLCHNYPTFRKSSTTLSDIMTYIKDIGNKSLEEKKAFIYGFFYGDGSSGKYDCNSGKKYSWALNQKNIENCLILQSLCEEVFENKFKIIDTIKSSGVYKIVPNCGNVKKYVDMFRPKCYNKNKYKIIPNRYLNGSYKERMAYFSGYYWADGSKCLNEKTKCIRVDNKGKIGSAMLYYLMKSLGFNVSVNTRKDKHEIIRLTATTNKQRKNPNIIKKKEFIRETTDFVYDIETKTGNFNTGFPLIVKNTDSCFMTFSPEELDGTRIKGKKALDITIQLAIECGEVATKYLKAPHDLEYEKTFDPFLLLSKKRYVGMLYEHDINKCKRKSMGIVLKRRDNAPVVKDIYGGIIDIIMKEQNIEKAVLFTKKFLQDIIDEKIPLEKLIITKSLREFYKNPESIAHKVLADRMGKRDPGNKPSTGSRIPFVYIKTKKKVKLQGDKIEHPSYIKENGLKPDYKIYITNQIMKPVMQIYALVLEELKEFKKHRKGFDRKVRSLGRKWKDNEKKRDEYIMRERNSYVKKLIFENALRIYENAQSGQKTIQSLFG